MIKAEKGPALFDKWINLVDHRLACKKTNGGRVLERSCIPKKTRHSYDFIIFQTNVSGTRYEVWFHKGKTVLGLDFKDVAHLPDEAHELIAGLQVVAWVRYKALLDFSWGKGGVPKLSAHAA